MFRLEILTEFIEKYVRIVTELINVDVEIVDYKLRRIAGSGKYIRNLDNINQVSNREILTKTLRSGRKQIMESPSETGGNTNSKIEISMPIIFDKNIIGVIVIASNDDESRYRIEEDGDKYLDLLEQIAEFITLKASEQEEDIYKQSMVSMLEIIIRNMDEGAIIINKQGKVNTINRYAKKQLGIKRIISNEKIDIKLTGDTVNNGREYIINIADHTNTVIGDIFKVPENPIFDRVMLFKDMKKVQSNLYAMTSNFNNRRVKKVIGKSEITKQLNRDIKKTAESDSTVLITGETGTGKETVAMAIWQNSKRSDNRFVTINCAQTSEITLERELFGYVKGVYQGKNLNGKIGKFELANNGIILLDEIDAVPLYLQSKILRVVQEKKITRIGSNQIIPLNIRIIATSNKNLKELILENKFREDLYYRLNTTPINIEPLRNRREDIGELVYSFIKYYCKQFSKNFYKLEDEALNILMDYNWPRNIRELESAVEYMVNMMEDGIIDVNSIPKDIVEYGKEKTKRKQIRISTLSDLEKNEIKKAIELYGDTTDGKKRAAEALGIGIATLYRKL